MLQLLSRLWRFLTTMDAKAATSLFVSVALLGGVVAMLIFGRSWLGLDDENSRLAEFLGEAASSPFALVGVIAIFSILALAAFPQILLYAATILTFGPIAGAGYAWVATMAAAALTFALGHVLGGNAVERFGGPRAHSTIEFISRHGIFASAIIRLVPSAPFAVVNAAGGVARIPFWKFMTGTGIGSAPKIGFVAALGAAAPARTDVSLGLQGLVDFFTSREPLDLLILGIAIPAWIAVLIVARGVYVRMRRRDAADQ